MKRRFVTVIEEFNMFVSLQEVAPRFPLLAPASSHSSDRSSRGCTPPLTSGSAWSGSRSPNLKTKSASASPSTRSKHSDTSSSSKSQRIKKKSSSKSSSKNGTLDSSLDTNGSMWSPPSNPSMSQPTSPSARSSIKMSYPSASSFASYTSGERKKKKSWIAASMGLSPNYRQRCEEVRKNFPGLPHNEMLIGDYSCALQKDILVHGRIYITTNYLCFYANIFRWETVEVIPWKQVTAMTKEKTALVIPNAVQICTGSDKYFFTSFAARDKSHVVMFRLWQNSLLDNPALAAELWSWVRSVYGDKTGR